MKKLYFLFFALITSSLAFGQSVFINEIHYDNSGTDSGEGVEIAGIAGTDVTGYQIVPYNGSGGANYSPIGTFSGTIPDQQNGYGTLWVAISGLQNGAPDAIALIDDIGTVIQFLSYEGVVTATAGPASGMTSTDINAIENGTNLADTSLQLQGSGDIYSDFTWTSTPITQTRGAVNTNQTFTSTNVPTLAMNDGPPNGFVGIMSPEDVNNAWVSFVTTNFTMSGDAGGGVSDDTGDGYIKWNLKNDTDNVTVSSGSVFTSNDNTKEFQLTGMVVGKTYTFTAELVDNTGASLATPVQYIITVTFPDYISVANLAALRAGTVSNDVYYKVTGEVINTYSRTFNNQKYFQDATGGILIHDPNSDENTAYNAGDGAINIRGHLVLYNGLLELVPTNADWGKSSTGNVVTPEVVTLNQLNTSLSTYESKLVKVLTVTVSDIDGGTGVYQSSKNYPITDESGSGIFRTSFSEADYIGAALPVAPVNLVCLVGNFNGVAQVTAINTAGITLGNKEFTPIEGFELYPNPATNILYIYTNENLTKDVQIFDLLGKKLVSKMVVGNSMDVNLPSGIYVIKVEEAGKMATQKLVVK